jgi:pimeloyl-ACP methyl ester carboxylesterase
MHLEDFDTHRAFVQTASADLSYVDIGEGRPAVFVHGVGTNSYLWRNVIASLAGEARCIALDLPLHGHSPARTDQDFSLAALAAVVADFCTALGLNDLDLVANDTGGAIAQIFAATHPELLHTFTLTNCDTQDNIPPEAFKATVELAKAGQLAPTAPGLLDDLSVARAAVFSPGFEDPGLPADDVVRAFLEPVIGTPTSAKQFERLLSALGPDDLVAVEPALRKLNVPTLIVWGAGDPFFELRWAYWLRDTIPGVTDVVEIDGAKLFFPDERAQDLVPHLRRHWAAAEAGRSSTRMSA